MTFQVNIGWQIWKFDRTLADLEPEQGVPRYITTEYEHKSSRMLRRGLAFQLEHGFWSTEEGKLNYAMNIQTIRSAVHETVYQSILHSLLNEGQALTKFYNARYNVANFTLKTALEFEKWRFGIVNKQQHGLELIDAELSKYLSREAVKPDVWVFPPKMKLYCSYATPAALEVFRSGEQMVAENRKASQQILSDSYFAGKQVFESREYAVDFSASPIDQLSRERQTGDYFLFKAGSETLVYDADYDDFMPVNEAFLRAKSGIMDKSAAPMPLLASGTQLVSPSSVKPEPTDRERMVAAGYSSQQIDQVLNCARCFQLAHLNHSSPAGFAADLHATPAETLARANVPENAINMSINSDACVVDAIEGRGDVSPAMRVACSLASGIVAGVPHSMLGLRYANIRGSEWYKNLHAAYETAKQMSVGNNGHASKATLRHAKYNGVDTDFVNWVAANVDGDSKLTQIALSSSSNAAGASAANADAVPLAWGALDALSSNLNVDGLSPVAVASLRTASAAVDGLNMSGDAQSVATTLAAVKRHWDAKLSDDYVSSNDSFLGVRRAQAKNASFGHFLANHVFTKDDAAARLAAGEAHADAAAAAKLNAVSAEGASVWNKLVASVAHQQGWPASASVPQSLNAWKMASASAPLSSASGSGSSSVTVPLAFRASDVINKKTQVQNIAASSAKPITMNNDAWAAVSFPFAGAGGGGPATFLNQNGSYTAPWNSNASLWKAIVEVITGKDEKANGGTLGAFVYDPSDADSQTDIMPKLTPFKVDKDFLETSSGSLKGAIEALPVQHTWPSPTRSYANTGPDNLFRQKAIAYFSLFIDASNVAAVTSAIDGAFALNAGPPARKPFVQAIRDAIVGDDDFKNRVLGTVMQHVFYYKPLDQDVEKSDGSGDGKADTELFGKYTDDEYERQLNSFSRLYYPIFLALQEKEPLNWNEGQMSATLPFPDKSESAAPLFAPSTKGPSLGPSRTGTPIDTSVQQAEASNALIEIATLISGLPSGPTRTALEATSDTIKSLAGGIPGVTSVAEAINAVTQITTLLDTARLAATATPTSPSVTIKTSSSGGGKPSGNWFLIERPFKTFRMGTGILAKGGETLGLTFYGHCNFQWSNNTTNKVHEGHFTFYSRPVVRDWRQYAIAEDIFVLGYVRGEVSGCNKDHYIDSSVLQGASVQDLHEIYGGEKGHLIVYGLDNKADDSLTDVRRGIANPHR